MWGTFFATADRARTVRFIPTYVGNMPGLPVHGNHPPVHPHVCGEHVVWEIWNTCGAGSSPRMWGTCGAIGSTLGAGRFIPTYVGNIDMCATDSIGEPVHPHVCGEHLFSSSRLCSGVRFIPTYVGNILKGGEYTAIITVHPHVCGEHHSSRTQISRYSGSSPRMWGTCVTWFTPASLIRFIPTYVGNIATAQPTPRLSPVHPHVCGEHGGIGRR